ncbi:hypothetical protein A2U01_0051734 [Trifolium medium]|uniref:Uncharacterized protein n=1 Tax=Trifolium medium TaxID=97028 RepID=A0A392R4P8_9FABA|nr:hypothetical protein [Trifolium medium]
MQSPAQRAAKGCAKRQDQKQFVRGCATRAKKLRKAPGPVQGYAPRAKKLRKAPTPAELCRKREFERKSAY